MAKKKSKGYRLPDMASEGAFEWTQADIDRVLEELGRRSMQGKFNPATWEGEDFKCLVAGQERDVVPKYFGIVYAKWLELTGGR